jgi:hypothetical protein
VSKNDAAIGQIRSPAVTVAAVPPRVAADSIYNLKPAGTVTTPIRAATFPFRPVRDPTRTSCGKSLYPGSTYSASVIVAPLPGFVRVKVKAFTNSLGEVKQRLRKRLSSLLHKRKDSGNDEDVIGVPTDARAAVYRQFDQSIFSAGRRPVAAVSEGSLSPRTRLPLHVEDADELEPLLPPPRNSTAGVTEAALGVGNNVPDLENDSAPRPRASSLAPTEPDTEEDCEEYRLYRVIDTLRYARGRQGCPFYDDSPPPVDRVADLEGYRRQECEAQSSEQLACPSHRLHPLFGPSEARLEAIYSFGGFEEEAIDQRFQDIWKNTREWAPDMAGIEDADSEDQAERKS